MIDICVGDDHGLYRGVAFRTIRVRPSCGASAICCLKSGEALSSTQSLPFEEMANDDWVRTRNPGFPARTLALMWPLQFHWGKPPPAAAPSMRIIMTLKLLWNSRPPGSRQLAKDCEKDNGGRDDRPPRQNCSQLYREPTDVR